jgi:hypothetical protein
MSGTAYRVSVVGAVPTGMVMALESRHHIDITHVSGIALQLD